ncbi:site-specific integrase [Mesorhizobium sp. M1339]|uniref:site-specific integrase n=1 Tax=Mesorhizobium sp. M1339 TaxID=2957086 RepID=UPI003339B390
MSQARSPTPFALVASFFTTYLPRQRGASPRTIRTYRDTLKLLVLFAAQRQKR